MIPRDVEDRIAVGFALACLAIWQAVEHAAFLRGLL
jgi:hypothetical protein